MRIAEELRNHKGRSLHHRASNLKILRLNICGLCSGFFLVPKSPGWRCKLKQLASNQAVDDAVVRSYYHGLSRDLLTASIISSRTRTPYTIVLVLFGLAIAGSYLPSLLGVNLLYDNLIGGGLFVGLVLPPLLFETMMNIRYEDLRSVVRPALRLATVGVLIATIVGGLFLWQIAQLPLTSSFIFASLIAPTDTATLLDIFRRARLPRKLSTLMETEAAFNDATGIAIFTIVITSFSVSQLSLFQVTTSFVTILGGGVLVGMAVALGAHFLSRIVTDPMSETMITITAVYG